MLFWSLELGLVLNILLGGGDLDQDPEANLSIYFHQLTISIYEALTALIKKQMGSLVRLRLTWWDYLFHLSLLIGKNTWFHQHVQCKSAILPKILGHIWSKEIIAQKKSPCIWHEWMIAMSCLVWGGLSADVEWNRHIWNADIGVLEWVEGACWVEPQYSKFKSVTGVKPPILP